LLGYHDVRDLIEAAASDGRQQPFSPDQYGILFDILRAQGEIVGCVGSLLETEVAGTETGLRPHTPLVA
jgi:hypothetical protein